MSDAWIAADNRLANAVGSQALANQILSTNYKRILAKVASEGHVTYQLINENGYIITGPLGIFNP